MKPYTRSIIELFDGKKRYLIPLYQRQYAWSISPQLELLWEDIERAIARLESNPQYIKPHFMGAIVISMIKTFGKQVQAFEVIDGQQRLTTFQLLLAALGDVANRHASDYADEVNKLLLNDGLMESSQIERFKLWPTAIDRRNFIEIIDPDYDFESIDLPPLEDGARIRLASRAHAWFVDRIEQYVKVDGCFEHGRMDKLYGALRDGLAAVSIELESGDDPQTIFETLNSRGVDLSAGDLMRNFIFQRAKGMGQEEASLNVDKLYAKYWLPLDQAFWTANDTRGRQTKTRLDWLLVDHLSMKRASIVSVDRLFDEYRRWILAQAPFDSIEHELRAISDSARIYREIVEQSEDSVLGKFGRFSRAFDVSTAMPLALYFVIHAADLSELANALSIIEAFIVRRDICGLTTKNYNLFFIEIIEKIGAQSTDLLKTLETSLSRGRSEINRWPTDEEFRVAWIRQSQYKNARQPRLRYIFEAIEKSKRSSLNEDIKIQSVLTIEHIMPQRWQQHWPIAMPNNLEYVEQVTLQERRSSVINNLGNLTLLTHALNAAVSNGSFDVKMPAIKAQTSLALNRELDKFADWNEDSILQRGESLFETARTIWRGPSGS